MKLSPHVVHNTALRVLGEAAVRNSRQDPRAVDLLVLPDPLNLGGLAPNGHPHDSPFLHPDAAKWESPTNESDNPDIDRVYSNLERGSANHLRAFIRQLDRRDANYEPTELSQAEFDEIINSVTGRKGFGA